MATRALKHRLNDVLSRYGFEITRRRPKLIDFLRSRSITTLLDIGANEGQFAAGMRVRGYSGRIVSFEPTRTTFAILKAKTASDSRWEARQTAIGASDGRAELRITGYSEFNSFLSPTKALVNLDTRAASEHVEEVEVRALDSIFDQFRGERVFVKSDTQGYEAHVLAGARRSLPHIAGVQLEIGFVEMYAGQSTFIDLLRTMEEAGFALALIEPNHFVPDDPNRLLEVDCVFANTRAG
jgi:FkbM family methyltransferase